jgi:transmembrane sensor
MSGARAIRNDVPADRVSEEAALWHERMNRQDVPEETRQAFARWHEVALHSQAYGAIERAWGAARSAAEDPAILALRHETALRLTRKRWRPSIAHVAIAAVVVLTIAALMLPATWFAPGSTTQVANRTIAGQLLERAGTRDDGRYATATGERLVVTLPDGSRITLNTRSEVNVDYTPRERSVRLLRGQALFEVAKEAGRPFVVTAHERRLVAVGTAFDVRMDGPRLQVTMVEGTVAVERAAGAYEQETSAPASETAEVRAPLATLIAGDQLLMEGEQLERVRITDPQRVTSWQRGQVIFDNTRLVDAVEELNRYSDVQIQLTDATLGELRLSGAFVTGRQKVFTEAVTTYFPIEVTREDATVIVLSSRR